MEKKELLIALQCELQDEFNRHDDGCPTDWVRDRLIVATRPMFASRRLKALELFIDDLAPELARRMADPSRIEVLSP